MEFGMSQQDRSNGIIVNHQVMKQVIDELVPPKLFRGIACRSDAKWKPRMLVVAVLFLLTSGEKTLGRGFKLSRKVVAKIFRWQSLPGETYQGFVKQLLKWHEELKWAMVMHLHTVMQERLPHQWTVGGFVVIAGDGSRVEVSRTRSLEAAYSPKKKQSKAKKKGKKSRGQGRSKKRTGKRKTKAQSKESIQKKINSPQMWLTLMWHVGSGLPWDWRTGPSDSSERSHLEEMLANLPENALITADSGFVGYDFWSGILKAGHHFVIRVGGNVRLIRELGYARQHAHTVYLWPNSAAKNHQPPLKLRLIVLNDGRQPVYLVTDLPKNQLSDRQAAEIYEARWGIELFFRTFKQTFGCRKLRSKSAENAAWELDWSLIGLWCVCLWGELELAQSGKDPTQLSAANAITAFQDTLRHYRVRPESPEETLRHRLQLALLDEYERTSSKASRNFPKKKQRERTGPPKISKATKQQIQAAKQLTTAIPEKRLTA
jgi:hypothetical protein